MVLIYLSSVFSLAMMCLVFILFRFIFMLFVRGVF